MIVLIKIPGVGVCVLASSATRIAGAAIIISTHFHSHISLLGLFTSVKNEYSTAATENAIDRSAVTR
jgi:hypothetical protein